MNLDIFCIMYVRCTTAVCQEIIRRIIRSVHKLEQLSLITEADEMDNNFFLSFSITTPEVARHFAETPQVCNISHDVGTH